MLTLTSRLEALAKRLDNRCRRCRVKRRVRVTSVLVRGDPLADGYECCVAGRKLVDNPHPRSSPEAVQWSEGWQTAAGYGVTVIAKMSAPAGTLCTA
jgi:hypothetical protein